MQYTVTQGEKGKIELRVDVPKAVFDAAYSKILLQFAAQSNISGFRPGKAPDDVVEGHVGYNKILNQTASSLISQHLGEILKKEDLVPLDSPKIAINTLSKSSPFSFTVAFTQKPQVKVGDWKKIKVGKVAVKEVTDEDVAESIKNIFEAWCKQQQSTVNKQQTTEKLATVEEAEEKVKFIYDAHGNRIPIKDQPAQPTPGVNHPPSDRGSNPKAQTTPSGVEPQNGLSQVPDDEFAKAIGARDLAHLKELVKKDLETIVADQVEAKLEQDIFEEILKISDVEVPHLLVDDELNRLLVRLSSELEKQGGDLDKYLLEQKTTIDELKAKWRPQAEKNVKITLVMDAIGRGEKVQVGPEEVEQALKGVSETNLSPEQRADLERYLALSIFQAKTLDLVKKTVSVA